MGDRLAAPLQPRSDAALDVLDLPSPLGAVPTARSTRMSYHRRSPSAAPSCARSSFRSPMSDGCASPSQSCSWVRRSPSVVSSRGKSRREPSRQSRRSRSPSRTSFRGGSAFLGREKRSSRSRLPSQSRQADEDLKEEQFPLDLLSIVTNLHSLNELLEAPSESCKIRGFGTEVEDDDQPASLYKMPIGGASAGILADIDDRVSLMSSVMHSRKVSKLLQYPGVRGRKFYRFEGEDVTKATPLNLHVTELAGLLSFKNLNKVDVIWSSTGAEDMEAALRSMVDFRDEVFAAEVHQ